MNTFKDTWTMAKRSLKHIVRSPDTIITVVIMPIMLIFLFVYILGGALGQQTGGVDYINYITPGIIIFTVISGVAYTAFRLNNDIQKGIISRFRTMPVAPSSILNGQAISSALSSLVSSLLVLAVAFAIGFRTDAGVVEWLLFIGLTLLLTLAMTWVAIFFGLLAKSAEGASTFSYVFMLLIFISPSFVPTDSMTPLLRGFAEHQPLTPIVETMRSLLTNGTASDSAWLALVWTVGILVVFYVLSLIIYRRRGA